jgi:hydroxyethylthiazole kinase
MTTTDQFLQRTWDDGITRVDVAAVRAASPLTHCVTNYVAAPLTANILLAVGAVPAMVATVEEVVDFAAIASGVLLNVGTITTESAEVFRQAAASAQRAGTPWVLDPVAVGAGLRLRDQVAAELLEYRPTVIRGNGSEILGLAGAAGGGKGPDSTATSGDALPVAVELARATGAVVAISGVVDFITDGQTTLAVPGGHVLMTKVTGVGCSLGGLIAAFAGVIADPLRAAASASALLATAGERAARTSAGGHGTGSFAVALLDQLSTLEVALHEDLVAILACPVDHGPLAIIDDTILYNPRLRRSYPVVDGIPVLLAGEAADVTDADHKRFTALASGWTGTAR